MTDSIFQKLAKIDVTKKIVQKNRLDYLPWADAWAELCKSYPDATYKIGNFGESQLPYIYDGNMGYMVFTEVTIGALTHEMFLPVMDGANKAMKKEAYTYNVKDMAWNNGYSQQRKDTDGTLLFIEKQVDSATMFDVNKTIMRCLVKNIAMFGLGLSLYAKDDIVFDDEPDNKTGIPAIDNATDADSLNKKGIKLAETQAKVSAELAPPTSARESTQEQRTELRILSDQKGITLQQIHGKYKRKSLLSMTWAEAKEAIDTLRARKDYQDATTDKN